MCVCVWCTSPLLSTWLRRLLTSVCVMCVSGKRSVCVCVWWNSPVLSTWLRRLLTRVCAVCVCVVCDVEEEYVCVCVVHLSSVEHLVEEAPDEGVCDVCVGEEECVCVCVCDVCVGEEECVCVCVCVCLYVCVLLF